MEYNRYVPESETGETKPKFIITDISESAKEKARDLALARMVEKPVEDMPKGWKKIVSGKFWKSVGRQIWHQNLAKDFLEVKYQKEEEKKIQEAGSLFAGEQNFDEKEKGISDEEKERRILARKQADERTTKAITDRFHKAEGDFAEDLIHSELGEKIDKLGDGEEEKKIKTRIQRLIKEYAGGYIDETGFLEGKKLILGSLKAVKPEIIDKGEVYADNLLDMAKYARTKVEEQVRLNIDHNVAVMSLDLDFEFVVGKAKTGAKTEAQFNAVEKVVDKIQKHTRGVFNESLITAVVSAAYVVKNSLFTRAASTVAGLGGIAVGAGVTAAVREGRMLEKEKMQHAREMAQGRNFEEGSSVRRGELEAFRLKFKTAKELELNLQSALFEKIDSGKELSAEEYTEAVKALAEINSRILEGERGIVTRKKKNWQFWKKGDTRNRVDLIGYSDPTKIAEEEGKLDIARARAKVVLKEWALSHGKTAEQFKAELQDGVEKNIASFYEGEEGIVEQNKRFKKFKHAKMWQSAKSAAKWGVIFGVGIQEVTALAQDTNYGVLEHGWDAMRGQHHTFVAGEHATALESGVQHIQKGVQAGMDYFFPSTHALALANEFNVNSAHFKLGDGMQLVPDSSTADPNDYMLVDKNGNALSGTVHVNPDGTPAADFKQWLVDHHYTVNESMVGGGARGVHDLNLTETVAKYPGLAEHARIDWHDEPGEFWSEIHKEFIEFEGKQQMGFLEKIDDKVYLNCNQVIANFKQELLERVNNSSFGQVEGYVNPDGSAFVDPGMAHLKQQIIEAVNSGELEKHFQAVVIPTEGANSGGLSDLMQGADANGRILLSGTENWSDYFTNSAQLKDGHLPFKFLEMRFDGHVMNTIQGASESVAGVPNIEILPPAVVLPTGNELPPVVFPPLMYAGRRKNLEGTKWVPGIVEPPPDIVYGGYGRPREEMKKVYRERLSPTLKENPEAVLDFEKELEWYKQNGIEADSEYAKSLSELLAQPGMAEKMDNECKAVSCIPVYTLGEGKTIAHTLDQYRKQIENGSVKSSEFELILFLNHPQDKVTPEMIANFSGAEERVRSGKPEAYDTQEVVRQYQLAHPEIKIRVMTKEFEKRPQWGVIIKHLYDAACLRAGARSGIKDKDVLILTNDADLRDMSDKYLRSLIDEMKENEAQSALGGTTRIDGLVGRIDHDNETYKKWPNFMLATRFDQFLDAQNRYGYKGSEIEYQDGVGYVSINRITGEKQVITQGRNTALRASAYCAIGGARTNKDAGADTELGDMVREGRRGVEPMLKKGYSPFKYQNSAWLETDPRRELGTYKQGKPIASAWNDWDKMDVYGKTFEEQIEGDDEDISPTRLEHEFEQTMRKWGLSADAPQIKSALAWLGLSGVETDASGRKVRYEDYQIVDGKIKIVSVDRLKKKMEAWKPKRERVETSSNNLLKKEFSANPFGFIYGNLGKKYIDKGVSPDKLTKDLFQTCGFSDADYENAKIEASQLNGLSSPRKMLAELAKLLVKKDVKKLEEWRASSPTEYKRWASDVVRAGMDSYLKDNKLTNRRIDLSANSFGIPANEILKEIYDKRPTWKQEAGRRIRNSGVARNTPEAESIQRELLQDIQAGRYMPSARSRRTLPVRRRR